ncbi:hypothetical protein GRF59_14320 [Paenibacillus sp. HJL G12]|uniref:Uncharacterized protein n=1 Tax=Paenibacillus dendrobii TaxID=2691084 RepID=A0A7X3IMI3_9BACL|nr:hypothetical protein [Paenibacillus dendrobii]MWV44792.1 hypothetical protein [Paenibacillus dendrobii]
MEVKIIRTRLRKHKDKDLQEAMSKIPIYYDQSDIMREALRQFLFGHLGRKPQLLGSEIMKCAEDIGEEELVKLEEVEITDEDLEAKLDEFILE